jgi:hypothetical protein
MGNHKEEFRLGGAIFDELNKKLDRRHFLSKTSLGLGGLFPNLKVEV